MKKIIIKISPDGTIQSKTENIKGKQCMKYLGAIEKMTESRVVDSEFTHEYNETEVVESQNVLLEDKV